MRVGFYANSMTFFSQTIQRVKLETQ